MNAVEKAMAGYDFYECRAWGHKWKADPSGRDGFYLQTLKPNTATLKHVGRVSVCTTCNAQRVERFEIVLWQEKEPRKGWRGPVDVPEDVARTYIETEKAFQSAHDALMEYIGW